MRPQLGNHPPRLRQGMILCLSWLHVLLPWESGLFRGVPLTDAPSWETEGPLLLSALLSKGSCLCPCPSGLTHCPLFLLAGECPTGKGSDKL